MIKTASERHTLRGYTLLEMIVAVGIFSVIMLLATGAYLTLINLNRQIQATDSVVTNLSFVLENMARNIRTGTNYCTAGYSCGGSTFTYIDTQGRTVTYFLDGNHAIARTIGAQTDELTDPKTVTIVSLAFYPRGYAKNDGIEPSVTMVINGTADAGGGKTTSFTIQTGATERSIDL